MKKTDTSQNYEHYKQLQIERSDLKWFSISFKEKEFNQIISDCIEYIKDCKVIVCMGIRGGEYNRGNELGAFAKLSAFKESKLIGVDINPLVEKVEGTTYCYDFNNLPDDWANSFNLIYSNALDHSPDIQKTINEWYRIASPGGYMLLTLSSAPKKGGSDIYEFHPNDVPELFNNRFSVLKMWRVKDQLDFNVLVRVNSK